MGIMHSAEHGVASSYMQYVRYWSNGHLSMPASAGVHGLLRVCMALVHKVVLMCMSQACMLMCDAVSAGPGQGDALQTKKVVYLYPSVGKELASVLIMGSHHTRAPHEVGVERALIIPHKHAHPHSLPSLFHQ